MYDWIGLFFDIGISHPFEPFDLPLVSLRILCVSLASKFANVCENNLYRILSYINIGSMLKLVYDKHS